MSRSKGPPRSLKLHAGWYAQVSRRVNLAFCTSCRKAISDDARYCASCGATQSIADAVTATAQGRTCPFCRQTTDSMASRCPHCGGQIGRLQDCIQCPRCSEMVLPITVAATNEKGWGTDAARVALGGGYYLASASEETYTACPVCQTPIAYCPNCQRVTPSLLDRKWVGVGRSKSGYQFRTSCALCSSKVSGPSCFIATVVQQTTLDATLLSLYILRDSYLNKSALGRLVVRAYYRHSPQLALWVAPHARICRMLRACLHGALRLVQTPVVRFGSRL